MSLEVEIMRDGPEAVVVARGEIDLATQSALRDALEEASESAEAVVLDLTDVSFLDSSGLRVLAQWKRRLSDGGGGSRLRVVVHGTPVQRIFEVTGLDSFFDVYDTRDAAVRGR
jgi:anti-sigma B factor antagonist